MSQKLLADNYLWTAMVGLLLLTASQIYTWFGVTCAYRSTRH
uniref:Uncharacterized protein n=1 Tax=Methylophaga nitratireducenticrescens TaxID=754476 RepID=I1XIX0_METNJ